MSITQPQNGREPPVCGAGTYRHNPWRLVGHACWRRAIVSGGTADEDPSLNRPKCTDRNTVIVKRHRITAQ
uniref:Uncharacterized protein n=1 Tax=Nymphaea colorata TaxID=210225 RepID=A0A5K1CVH9_9MAGN